MFCHLLNVQDIKRTEVILALFNNYKSHISVFLCHSANLKQIDQVPSFFLKIIHKCVMSDFTLAYLLQAVNCCGFWCLKEATY
jgi:hypothetical protein